MDFHLILFSIDESWMNQKTQKSSKILMGKRQTNMLVLHFILKFEEKNWSIDKFFIKWKSKIVSVLFHEYSWIKFWITDETEGFFQVEPLNVTGIYNVTLGETIVFAVNVTSHPDPMFTW